MSGPKSFIAPPGWLRSLLDKGLEERARVLAEIERLEALLRSACVSLPDGRQIRGAPAVDAVASRLIEARRPLTFPGNPLTEAQWKEFIRAATSKSIACARGVLDALKAAASEIEAHRNDVNACERVRRKGAEGKSAVDNYRAATLEYIEKYLASDSQATAEARRRLAALSLVVPVLTYKEGCSKSESGVDQQLRVNIDSFRDAVSEIRRSLVGKSQRPLPTEAKMTPECQRAQAAVLTAIDGVREPGSRLNYQRRLEELLAEGRGRDPYYLDELHDAILQDEESRAGRIQILELMDSLEAQQLVGLLELREAAMQASQEKVSPRDLAGIRERLEAAATKAREQQYQRLVDAQGRELLRRAVVTGMEALGYRVADDLQTLDLSKPGEVLLRIPGKESAVSMRLPDRDGFSYRFLIPEKSGDLLPDEQGRRLDEMKGACDDFKRVVDQVRASGIPLQLEAEAGINARNLLTMTDDQRARLSSQQGRAARSASPRRMARE